MEKILILIVPLAILFYFVNLKYGKKKSYKDCDYKHKKPLLKANESAFYNSLITAVGEQGIVLSKVSIANVIAPEATEKKQWANANSYISRGYFDFVVCDPRTLEVKVVIELNDDKELTKPKIEREKLLIYICHSAGIPLIGASVKHSYQVSRLRRLLASHIDLIEPEKEVRFCKKCGSPMVIKVATKGDHKGRRFFTCSRQPNCTYTENYNVIFEEAES